MGIVENYEVGDIGIHRLLTDYFAHSKLPTCMKIIHDHYDMKGNE